MQWFHIEISKDCLSTTDVSEMTSSSPFHKELLQLMTPNSNFAFKVALAICQLILVLRREFNINYEIIHLADTKVIVLQAYS